MYLNKVKNILLICCCIVCVWSYVSGSYLTLAEQTTMSNEDSIDDLVEYIASFENKRLTTLDTATLRPIVDKVELLGCLRAEEAIVPLSKMIEKHIRVWSVSRGFNDSVFAGALARIANYECVVAPLKVEANLGMSLESNLYMLYCSLMPPDSIIAVIEDYIESRKNIMSEKENKAMIKWHQDLLFIRRLKGVRYKPIPFHYPISDFTLNHPLYKARQLAIKTNLELAQRILNSNKNLSLIDAESKLQLLAAVEELAKVRAVEAVEVLAPILLLQSDKEIANLDKKYFSLQKYPVGIALAKIGIPSIWGLLDEVAKRSDNADEYRKIAHNVMTTILIEKAISGFVNEILIKYKDDELAQIRLAKLLLLLGEDAEKIALLKPQFRTWKTTDGLFETYAKFISIDKNNEVKLEKENGNKTTIELHALQKNDQDYVKEFITINKK